MHPSRPRWIAATLAAAVAGPCLAGEIETFGSTFDLGAPKPARGWLGIGFQSVHTQGSLDASGDDTPFLRRLETDSRTLILSVDYRFNERWSAQASLPYIRKRSVNDPGAHNPLQLVPPRPESEFLDDGRYHGTWQDWQVGVTYHTRLRGFDVRPHAVLTWPSSDYAFFGSAAPGQRLRRLRLGFDASRRLGRSNFHYSAGYSYEIVEEVLGVHLDRHHLRLSGRYDFSPQWSGNLFVVGRDAPGIDPSINLFAERMRGSELWYQHDRLLPHNYGLAGIGATWRFNDLWSISASTSRMVWGDTIHDIKYVYDVQITRGF